MQCKQYRMGLLCFFNNKNLFHLKKQQKNGLTNKKRKWVGFRLEKNWFLSTLIILRSFRDFPLITRSGTSLITISLITRSGTSHITISLITRSGTSHITISLITRSGTSHITISLIGCAPHTYSIGPWYLRSWELLVFE